MWKKAFLLEARSAVGRGKDINQLASELRAMRIGRSGFSGDVKCALKTS
jgi:hypothetical protein